MVKVLYTPFNLEDRVMVIRAEVSEVLPDKIEYIHNGEIYTFERKKKQELPL